MLLISRNQYCRALRIKTRASCTSAVLIVSPLWGNVTGCLLKLRRVLAPPTLTCKPRTQLATGPGHTSLPGVPSRDRQPGGLFYTPAVQTLRHPLLRICSHGAVKLEVLKKDEFGKIRKRQAWRSFLFCLLFFSFLNEVPLGKIHSPCLSTLLDFPSGLL